MLDRVQIVRNFTRQVIISQALNATPTTPYDAATPGQRTKLDTIGRVGRLRVIIPVSQAVTVTDSDGGAYTLTNPAGVAPIIHEIPIINGHLHVKLSAASGTVAVVVLTD
jgi:hypothetical protein